MVSLIPLTNVVSISFQIQDRQHRSHNRREQRELPLRVRSGEHHLSRVHPGHPRRGCREVHHIQRKYTTVLYLRSYLTIFLQILYCYKTILWPVRLIIFLRTSWILWTPRTKIGLMRMQTEPVRILEISTFIKCQIYSSCNVRIRCSRQEIPDPSQSHCWTIFREMA